MSVYKFQRYQIGDKLILKTIQPTYVFGSFLYERKNYYLILSHNYYSCINSEDNEFFKKIILEIFV